VRPIANLGASKYIPRMIVLPPVQPSSICGGYCDRDRDGPNEKLRLPHMASIRLFSLVSLSGSTPLSNCQLPISAYIRSRGREPTLPKKICWSVLATLSSQLHPSREMRQPMLLKKLQSCLRARFDEANTVCYRPGPLNDSRNHNRRRIAHGQQGVL
jgi:hypothetical protein